MPRRNAMTKNLSCAGLALCAAIVATSFAACRGGLSDKPPIHPVLDMDFQQKLKAQTAVEFEYWADRRSMRTPPAGTVARGSLDDDALEVYQDADGKYVANPVAASEDVVRRGREQFDIFCAVCHDRAGSGNGLVLQRARLVSPTAFNATVPDLAKDPRLVAAEDGYLFHVMTNGLATMPSYAGQIAVADRWAIVHYLRALQLRLQ